MLMFHWLETDLVTVALQAKAGRTITSQDSMQGEETTMMKLREVVVLPVLASGVYGNWASFVMLFLRSPLQTYIQPKIMNILHCIEFEHSVLF